MGEMRGLAQVQAAAGVTPGEARLADEAGNLFFSFRMGCSMVA